MKNKVAIIFYVALLPMLLLSCRKFLDKKPDKALAVPTTLLDFKKLLENPALTEYAFVGITDVGSDEYNINPAAQYLNKTPIERNAYAWANDIYQGNQSINDWDDLYRNIYVTNVVIDGIKDVIVNTPDEQAEKNRLVGQALFMRSSYHFSLEEAFGQPYRPATASTDLGIPLRLKPDLTEVSVRATVKQVFDQIVSDLLYAETLLPPTSTLTNRASKAAVFALLARISLTMQDYTKAHAYANASLQLKGVLYDYNLLNPPTAPQTPGRPFLLPPFDVSEIIYYGNTINYLITTSQKTDISPTIQAMYENDDLRRTVCFAKTPPFLPPVTTYHRGKYSGNGVVNFGGLATDEVYLIRAEANARLGNRDLALADLDKLLIKRYRTGTYVPRTAVDAEAALVMVLNERKKELIFRGLRWMDLRRLNQDPRFAITLSRNVPNVGVVTLPPNDPRYTYPIPPIEITISGLPQNPR